MMVKEYLHSISRLESFITSKRQRAEAFRCLASNIGGAPLSDMPKAPSRSISPMADAICKAIDLEAEIQQDELQLQQKKLFLLELVGTLSDIDTQSVLIKRYFEKKSWQAIIDETFFSRSWVYRLHQNGLDELDKKLASCTVLP